MITYFRAAGTPRPKGSNFVAMCGTARRIRCGARPFVTQTSQKVDKAGKLTPYGRLHEWTQAVRLAQRPVAPSKPFSGAVELRVVFHLEKPKSRSRDPYPVKQSDGDIDKLLRAVMDAVQTQVKNPGHMLADDSQVVKIVAEKRWATEEPGVEVEIVRLEQEQETLI